MQDAFLAARGGWDAIGEPYAYLRAAVVNRTRTWGRRLQLERRHSTSPDRAVALDAVELWDALATLNERQRGALVLRFYEDLPDADIAALLGCRPATVRTTIHRGLATLRKEIER